LIQNYGLKFLMENTMGNKSWSFFVCR